MLGRVSIMVLMKMTNSSKAARVLSRMGASKGGKAAAAKMTKAQLSARATKASSARWAKRDVSKGESS